MSRPTCDTVIVTRRDPMSIESTPPAGPAPTFSPRPSTRRHDVMKWRAYLWERGGGGGEVRGSGAGERAGGGGDRRCALEEVEAHDVRREQPLE